MRSYKSATPAWQGRRSPRNTRSVGSKEFVNYDRLPGPFRGYLESMGLLWFWNFKLRSVKVALSIVRNNPLHALLSFSLPQPEMFGTVGSPVSDNLFSVMEGGRLEYSIGPGQGVRAITLNPVVNLFT